MEEQPTSPAPATVSAVPERTHEPRNFLVTFLLASSFGVIGLRHFYLGEMQLGWIRTGLFAGGYVWLFLLTLMGQGALAWLGILAITVALIWAAVDFFYVYFSVRKDGEGKPLVATARDKKWAKVLFWVTIIFTVVVLVGSIVVASVAENAFRNSLQSTSPGDSIYDQRIDQEPAWQSRYN